MVHQITYQIKYEMIYNTMQTTAMNKIPQYGQQRQQRRPSRPAQRRAGPVRSNAGQASWGAAGVGAAATVVFYSKL